MKQHIYLLGLQFIYVTLFSSNIYTLVINWFYVTQKTYICYCSPGWHMLFKKSHNMHMFFLVCSTPGPMSSPDTVSKFTVSQWDHTSSMFGYHDQVSTVSSQRDCSHSQTSVITTWQTGVGGGPYLRVQLARQDMCQVTLYSKIYHPNSCQISHVDFFVLFLYPATEV